MSMNLLLDKKSSSGKSFHDLMMDITPENCHTTPLFHTIDKQWRSDNVVMFTFRPEYESEARTIVAGLIPYFRDEGPQWFLKNNNTCNIPLGFHHQAGLF
jgi:hypothetical protein